ncbi:ABC-2 family transporter protein [bacterium]|nr:ABC-2 family transporter protein [bacterium]
MTTAVAAYGSFIKVAFLNMLSYRMRYFTGVVTYLLFVSVHYYIWKAVYAGSGSPQGVLQGYTFVEMGTYIAIAWIARSLYFSNVDEQIEDLVTTGQIGVYLTRPVHFQSMMLVQAFGETLFRLCFFTAPILTVLLLVFPILPPASGVAFFGFILATLGSFIIFAQFNFLVGLLAFFFKSIEGVIRAKYYLIQLFSGLLIPITFFPSWLGLIAKALPFQAITYVPLQIYLGKAQGLGILGQLGFQWLWILILYLAGEYFWKKAFNRLTIQGG